ncbi:MAG: Exodeoxyribonuclease 7 large subunit [Phycisphaerae bacterium]|nr:Exodeoxyribonuclease 7 large subunit [Phycisphaerae bacterium]
MADRPPFDPSRIQAPAETAAGAGRDAPQVLSVRQVTALVRGALARGVPATLHVLGELADLSRPASGHLYFTLKDASSELRAVMWRSSAIRMRFTPEPGLEVIATGSIEVYEPRGVYQLVVTRLEPRGIGALELAFRQLRDRLAREGLFDAARKRPLPRVPFRVGLVTSPRGAAIRDILQTLQRRFPRLDLIVAPVPVQGPDAAPRIADAIAALNRWSDALGGIDVLIVGRGGGSLEDLWAFNEEAVARAIVRSAIPVVSAVGHEVDVTIADFVADVRAATPTAAAELVAPRLVDVLEELDRDRQRCTRCLGHSLELRRARLDALAASDWLARPLLALRHRAQRLDELAARLRSALLERRRLSRERLAHAALRLVSLAARERFERIARRADTRLERLRWALLMRFVAAERRAASARANLERGGLRAGLGRARERLRQIQARLRRGVAAVAERCRTRLEARAAALEACHPRRVLQRGFSITRDARSRKVVRSIEQVRDGQRLISELSDGQVRSTADDPRQPGLFDG